MDSAYPACRLCGGRLRRDSKHGVCSRNPDCWRELQRLRREDRKEARAAEASAWYQANKEHRREYQRKDRAARPEIYREREQRRVRDPEQHARAVRKYLARPDRSCRYARAGCVEFSLPGGQTCRAHRTLDNRRHWRAWDARQREILGERQGWVCPWCERAIKPGAKTDIDHIIPKACGVVIEEDWNLQLLHRTCNRSKQDKITDQALALAAVHGIELVTDGHQQVAGSRYVGSRTA